MKIDIYISRASENEDTLRNLGIETSGESGTVELTILPESIAAYWIDPDNGDLIIYTSIGGFRSPYKKELINTLEGLLN